MIATATIQTKREERVEVRGFLPLLFQGHPHRADYLGREAGRRRGFTLAYFLSWSKGTGRVSRTVTLVLSAGFMVDS